jgi:hypothetical protein
MEIAAIPAVAAFSGSASGALATILTSWVTQRRKDRSLFTSRAIEKREKLYKSFIEEGFQVVCRRAGPRTRPRFRSLSTFTR